MYKAGVGPRLLYRKDWQGIQNFCGIQNMFLHMIFHIWQYMSLFQIPTTNFQQHSPIHLTTKMPPGSCIASIENHCLGERRLLEGQCITIYMWVGAFLKTLGSRRNINASESWKKQKQDTWVQRNMEDSCKTPTPISRSSQCPHSPMKRFRKATFSRGGSQTTLGKFGTFS